MEEIQKEQKLVYNEKLININLKDYGFESAKISRYDISKKLTKDNKVIFLVVAPNGKY